MKIHRGTQSRMLIVLGAIVLLVGCAQSKPISAPYPTRMSGVQQQGGLIREAQEEANKLRSELGASKIAMAKQAAALNAVQKEAAELRDRENKLAIQFAQVQEELSGTQAERNQLRRQNAELQTRSTALPHLQQLATDIKAMQTSMNQMITTMKSLMSDVTQIKQDIRKNRQKLREQNSKLTAFSVRKNSNIADSSTDITTIQIKAGDTLWQISQAYGISVQRIKEMNGLESNLLSIGQRLRVPVLAKPPVTTHNTISPNGKNQKNGEREPAAPPLNDTPADTNEEP